MQESGFGICAPPWRQPRGKWMVSLVNSHTHATRFGWHLWEIDLRFALNSTPGWGGALTWRVRRGPRRARSDDASGEEGVVRAPGERERGGLRTFKLSQRGSSSVTRIQPEKKSSTPVKRAKRAGRHVCGPALPASTDETVRTRNWSWLPGQSPSTLARCPLRIDVSPRFEASSGNYRGTSLIIKRPPPRTAVGP